MPPLKRNENSPAPPPPSPEPGMKAMRAKISQENMAIPATDNDLQQSSHPPADILEPSTDTVAQEGMGTDGQTQTPATNNEQSTVPAEQHAIGQSDQIVEVEPTGLSDQPAGSAVKTEHLENEIDQPDQPLTTADQSEDGRKPVIQSPSEVQIHEDKLTKDMELKLESRKSLDPLSLVPDTLYKEMDLER